MSETLESTSPQEERIISSGEEVASSVRNNAKVKTAETEQEKAARLVVEALTRRETLCAAIEDPTLRLQYLRKIDLGAMSEYIHHIAYQALQPEGDSYTLSVSHPISAHLFLYQHRQSPVVVYPHTFSAPYNEHPDNILSEIRDYQGFRAKERYYHPERSIITPLFPCMPKELIQASQEFKARHYQRSVAENEHLQLSDVVREHIESEIEKYGALLGDLNIVWKQKKNSRLNRF